MPLETLIGGDKLRSEFHSKQCNQLEEKKWEKVDDFSKINVGLGIWKDVTPNEGSLYKKGSNAEAFLNASPLGVNPTLFMSEYIYVPLSPLVVILSRSEAGTLTAVFDYE